MNKVFIYEDTWQELLKLITYLIQTKQKDFNIKNNFYQANLLDEILIINLPDYKNIKQFWQKQVTYSIYRLGYDVFLSNYQEKELVIYYFFKNALKYGSKVKYMRNLNCTNKTLQISQYVHHEAHKMKGFLRFKKMKAFYYAEISPENNIIELIAPHFKKRLANENWLIKDVKRNFYCLYDKKQIYLLNGDEIKDLNLLSQVSEDEIEDLWKSFFKTIAIKERINKKCQRNFMPKKYWQYMIEMEDEI